MTEGMVNSVSVCVRKCDSLCVNVFFFFFLQEQLEHAEVSTALRYLGQYYFKNRMYDEASFCAQRCCDYNDVRTSHMQFNT